ncbi:MAG: hypothetical protein M1501_00250 [Candidatus Omnitrophica bacterium]|nr:hypothetical protein [Candidatus Omnitrophota bacterium]
MLYKKLILVCMAAGLMLTVVSARAAQDPGNGKQVAKLQKKIEQLQSVLNTLQKQVTQLEKNQTTQSRRTARALRRIKYLRKRSVKQEKQQQEEASKALTIHGHLKLYLFDQSWGTEDGANQSNNPSAGVSMLWLFMHKQITPNLSIEVDPWIKAVTLATPNVTPGITRSMSGYKFTLWKAYVDASLPHEWDLKAGALTPEFSEEYARGIFWTQLYHLPPGMCRVLPLHAAGVELDKHYYVGNWGIPVYFYLLSNFINSSDVGTDQSKAVMVHVAPNIFLSGNSQVKFEGSYLAGKWDNTSSHNFSRDELGLVLNYAKWTLKGEEIGGKWDSVPGAVSGTIDAKTDAYYIESLYRFNPKWQSLVQYSYAKDLPGGFSAVDGIEGNPGFDGYYSTYKTVTYGVDYFITPTSVIMGELSVGKSTNPEIGGLDYSRLTVGWRTDF